MLVYIKQQLSSTRNARKYARVLVRLVTIAILLWILLFNVYTLLFKLQVVENSKNHEILTLNLTPPKIIDSKSLDFYNKIQRRSYDVNCKSLIEWDEAETQKAKRILHKLRPNNNNKLIPLLSDSNFIFNESQCELFKTLRGYNSHVVTDFEIKFPLAFIILTYNNVEQFERLLRVIYRPQNVYCIHVDSKSSHEFMMAVRSISKCFKNVFITTKLERIVYASFTRLKADINCMVDLTASNKSAHPNLYDKSFDANWKYLINVASTEFPLRTNYELTKILNMFNGANDIEVITNFPKERIQYKWKVKRNEGTTQEYMVRTKIIKNDIPHNYTIVKGIAYCTFSRQFVDYALNNVYAKNLLKWSVDTYSPDEWYWATLQYNTQFNPPGGFRGILTTHRIFSKFSLILIRQADYH